MVGRFVLTLAMSSGTPGCQEGQFLPDTALFRRHPRLESWPRSTKVPTLLVTQCGDVAFQPDVSELSQCPPRPHAAEMSLCCALSRAQEGAQSQQERQRRTSTCLERSRTNFPTINSRPSFRAGRGRFPANMVYRS